LNKHYNEQEYWQKVDELKCAMLERGEYGDQFPVRFSQGYPAQTGMGWIFCMKPEDIEIFKPLLFEPADAQAFGPLADQKEKMKDQEIIPDSFETFTNDLIGTPIYDRDYKRPFSFQKQEIEFCKRYGIAPYTTHFLSRFWQRQKEMNLIIPIETNCAQCGKNIRTSKNYPDRKVYCRSCYLKYLEKEG
jgi:hypothetical protein